jgi:CheY-like chemotaxis protein
MTRILIVDDDAVVRGLTRLTLAGASHEVSEAVDGKEATARLREATFDLVILDLFMPEKDGFEMLVELRRDFPQVKIIVTSGPSYLAMAERLGARKTLPKPFTRDQLLSAVEAVLAE